MDARVLGQFRVERGGKEMVLFYERRHPFAFGQDLHPRADADEPGGADEHHLERRPAQGGAGVEDGRVVLAAVGVAFYGGVQDAERGLGGVQDLAREQDGAGAGTEGGFLARKGLKGRQEAIALEKFEKCGGFAAGNDQAVKLLKLFRFADEDKGEGLAAFACGAAQGSGVSGVVALDGENTDAERARGALRWSGHSGP